ncbi:ATP-binding protein [Cupriavidus sp. 30B13]|uniref:ATP-binding protein n=1 Tax=Cupriavidus sp. 30B13 TaxID=3384241 RepID=UPI003B901856
MSSPAPSKAERAGWLARHDTMFVRLFLVMTAIMLAVHVLGVTVIESIFPRPGAIGIALLPGDDPPPDDPGQPRAGNAGNSPAAALPATPAATGAAAGGAPAPTHHHLHPPRGLGPPRLGLLFQFAAIIAASWAGARLLARPVQSLASGAGRLAQDVHAPPLDEDSGPAEARAAAGAFNHMQRRIRTQLAQQSRFLAAVSHDLRTPLTRMSLRIEGVEDNRVRYRLRQDLAEMNGLIDATLYYLRERDGNAAPRQRVDVHALLQAVVDDANEIGQDVTLAGAAAPLLAYPAELRRAVVNLVENAHRYGGSARIELADSPERVLIDVCDNGPGIPPEDMARVLEPFYRLETSRSRTTGGVGMGLSIASDIVARHGGELNLANRPEGGLRVRITLPRA